MRSVSGWTCGSLMRRPSIALSALLIGASRCEVSFRSSRATIFLALTPRKLLISSAEQTFQAGDQDPPLLRSLFEAFLGDLVWEQNECKRESC